MIKIDFHIHTVKTSSDAAFEFSLDTLEKYVNSQKLDAVAITNHNLFDYENFRAIKKRLGEKVFPGIEIDLERGHMLVISNNDYVDDFCLKTKKISDEFNENKDVSIEFFNETFQDTQNYIFIPHYDKKPKIDKQLINSMGAKIFCGEVSNANKFVRLYKREHEKTPVLFSDYRPVEGSSFPNTQTYLDIDSIDFSVIKECLKDKEKVFLNSKKQRTLFPILSDGTLASTGLNVILGKRSSGKTHTMDEIYSTFGAESVKYIKQFELVEKNKEDAEKDFNNSISKEKSAFTDDYLQEFKELVEEINTIDLSNSILECGAYIDSLRNYAIESDKADSFAKVPIFKEQEFCVPENKELPKLITAVQTLLDSKTYKEEINEFIQRESLLNLFKRLTLLNKEKQIEIKIYEKTNSIIKCVKKKLECKSSLSPISSFDCNQYAKYILKIQSFKKLVDEMKKQKQIKKEAIGSKFYIEAVRKEIDSATSLKSIYKAQGVYSEAYSSYKEPYDYLKKLSELPQIAKGDLYKGFVQIEYSILNSDGLKVSGGQRAEYNLEQKLSDAESCDILLIDEPESSFDNIFLKEEIDTKIKELSKKMPVFVSTHNNVIGVSIKPDYVLYTEMTKEKRCPVFKIYGGPSGNKKLTAIDGSTIKNYELTMNCLEGGEKSYNERETTYENIKD